jgi:hypothetical protein
MIRTMRVPPGYHVARLHGDRTFTHVVRRVRLGCREETPVPSEEHGRALAWSEWADAVLYDHCVDWHYLTRGTQIGDWDPYATITEIRQVGRVHISVSSARHGEDSGVTADYWIVADAEEDAGVGWHCTDDLQARVTLAGLLIAEASRCP